MARTPTENAAGRGRRTISGLASHGGGLELSSEFAEVQLSSESTSESVSSHEPSQVDSDPAWPGSQRNRLVTGVTQAEPRSRPGPGTP